MKYSLYPGCAGEATAKEAWLATSSVLDFLGMDVTENNTYSCCGAGIVEEDEGVTVNSNVGQLLIDLTEAKDRDRSVFEVLADLRTRCQSIAGFERIEFANISGGPPTGKAVEVKVKGKHFDQLEAISSELQAVLAQVPGVYDIGDDFSPGKEELRVRLNEDRARLHGLDVMQVASIVRTAYHGATATVYRDGDEEIDVVVKLQNASQMSIEQIEDMKLAGHSQGTQDAYVRVVRQLAGHFRVSPDQLTERQLRDYLMHLREVRKVAKGTFQAHFFGIKFLFLNTLAYDWPLLTKKKSARPFANACPTSEATRTVAA